MRSAVRLRDRIAGTVDIVIVGAGHSGLAMSKSLSDLGIDHIVLERGEVANSWRYERWDSLRLLTPNWQSRLPGFRYRGADPGGYMTMPEVIDFIEGYGRFVNAPVKTSTTVERIRAVEDGYIVETDRGTWRCRGVVLASGGHAVPNLPALSSGLPPGVRQIDAKAYRNPQQIDDSATLVVGASATGLQIADELCRSGRRVMLAVGEHIRMPRVYRGRDIQYWMDAIGVLDERYDEVDDIVRARRVPSPQLIGSTERRTLDLNALTERGVETVGRLVGVAGSRLMFSGSLRNHCAMADLKLNRLLDRIDTWCKDSGAETDLPSPERFAATAVDDSPRLNANVGAGGICTVVWATGFRPDYSWLQVPAFDAKGRLRHDGGVVAAAGIYALGLNFMRRRKSSFMHGAEDDVRELSGHLAEHLRSASQRRYWATG